MTAMRRAHGPATAMAAVLILLPASAGAQTRLKSGFNVFSTQQDVEIGKEAAAEAEKKTPILHDRTVEEYVSTLGQRLAQNAPGHRFAYTFKVVDSHDLNAFALPGGPVYLNRGVLEAARNEGEVAGVLSHEISHVALRHGTSEMSKAVLTQGGISLLGGMVGGSSGGAVRQALGLIGDLRLLKYSRSAESQADVLGCQTLTKGGYNPQDLISFFQLLDKQDKSRTATWMSSHPAPKDRIARIQQEAAAMHVPLKGSAMTPGLRDVQARLRGLPSPPAGASGATGAAAPASSGTPDATASSGTATPPAASPGRVEPPSTRLRRYTSRSGLFQVDYPSNWSAHENGSAGVTLAPEGGIVEAQGRSDVVHGALLADYTPFATRRAPVHARGERVDTLGEATEDLWRTVTDASPYLRLQSRSTHRWTRNDQETMSAVLSGTNPDSRVNERITVLTRELPDHRLVYMLFVTPEEDARAYDAALQAMSDSLWLTEAAPR